MRALFRIDTRTAVTAAMAIPILAVCGLMVPGAHAAAADDSLQVVIIDPGDAANSGSDKLAAGLTVLMNAPVRVVRPGGSLAELQGVSAAIFLHGPGTAAATAAAVRAFIDRGGGMVVLGARLDAWPDEMALPELLGAVPGARFAEGTPLAVINLFAHPILTGVERLETRHPVFKYDKFADDAQMIIEGTVGEATTPLAWVRKQGGHRFFHAAFAEADLLASTSYQTVIANALRWTAGRPIPGARPAVQRTFMPEAYPGSFAITLPEGPGICLDPVRGGINYLWDGDFVDLRPRWLTKQGEPPRLMGEIFYQEKAWQPLRAGAPDGPADFQFRGYTLHDGWPEFHYRVGDREVYESFRATAGGGVVRRFRIEAGVNPLWLQLEPQAGAEVSVHGIERDGNLACYAKPAAGEFTIEIRRKILRSP